MLGAALRWVGRHALLFVIIVLAMLGYAHLRSSENEAKTLAGNVERLASAEADIRAMISGLEGKAVTALSDTKRTSLSAVAARRRALLAERIRLEQDKPGASDLLTKPRATIVATISTDIRLAVIDQELAFLQKLLPNATRIRDLQAAINGDTRNLANLAKLPSHQRYTVENGQLVDLAAFYRQRRQDNRQKLASAIAAQRAMPTPTVDTERLKAMLDPVSAAAAAERTRLANSLPAQAKRQAERLGIEKVLWPAALALLAIIAAPLIIRTLLSWVLAPLAALGRPIRLLAPGTAIPLPAERSRVSIGLTLTPGEELLVKQGYLQTSAPDGVKATQWLLDARFPLSSLAAGLSFLTRIRGGGRTTVSATRDPFAELVMLDLPPGAACVLQPRAIVGLVQAIDAPLRITSHWRLGTLNAWLTWQWRFLAFHGPARLILKGGRGVRIEPAETGRSIGQEQLIGFSAGLQYSSVRTETFLPYLLGREPLLNDRIAAGEGLLIAEEAPLAGRRGGVRSGLEGAMDAALKLFGI